MTQRPIRQSELIQLRSTKKFAAAIKAQAETWEAEAMRLENQVYDKLLNGHPILAGRYTAEIFGGQVFVDLKE